MASSSFQVSPFLSDAHLKLKLGWELTDAEDFEEASLVFLAAFQMFRKALGPEEEETNDALFGMASCLFEMGSYAEAAATFLVLCDNYTLPEKFCVERASFMNDRLTEAFRSVSSDGAPTH